jgi:hypothetical protein
MNRIIASDFTSKPPSFQNPLISNETSMILEHEQVISFSIIIPGQNPKHPNNNVSFSRENARQHQKMSPGFPIICSIFRFSPPGS